jgi:phosphoserine phosphatase RsbU/P
MRGTLLILCALSAPFIAAQGQSATDVLQNVDDGWHVHTGDDPAFAAPAFDDQSWPVIDFGLQSLPADIAKGKARWFRKQIQLPAQGGAIDLLLIGQIGSFEVYINGVRSGPTIQSSLFWTKSNETIYPLRLTGEPNRKDVEVAIRSHAYSQAFSNSLNFDDAAVGTPDAIRIAATAHRGTRLGDGIFDLTVNLLSALFGFILISLYFQQRGHAEYLWLGFTCLFFALCGGLVAAEQSGFIPTSINGFIGDPCSFFLIAAQIEFVYAFNGRRPGRAVRIYQALMIVLPLILDPLFWVALLPDFVSEWVENGTTLPGIILVFVLLVIWSRRGNREAGLLIAPLLLANVSGVLFDTEMLIQLTRPGFTVRSFHFGLVQFAYWPLSQAIFLLTIGLIIFLRFNRVSRDQARVQADLESARSIQQVLIPEAFVPIPGFRIESVYHPAQQVGGDFFQILPVGSGGVLAVIGDVSGKGLPAAMNVALIVGTLRTLAETTSSPAEILAGLNRRLLGRSTGFTTCLALHVQPGGQATLAGAGHLNPYLNRGDSATLEIAIGAALPLGLSSETEYPETQLALRPGDTLTLLTDGVLEARDSRTGDLFGFERMRGLSGRPAEEIAAAARNFGQEDDIAVLTLMFVGA